MRFEDKARGVATTRKIRLKESKAARHQCPKRRVCHMDTTRHWLAGVVVGSVVAVALFAVFAPKADAILGKLLPALMLILAYYFGRRR